MTSTRQCAKDDVEIAVWTPNVLVDSSSDIERLAELLHASVHAGASVSFTWPFSRGDAEEFWLKSVLPYVSDGSRRLIVAKSLSQIVASVQLDFATPPNQPHRAEVRKLLVHPDYRRLGIASSLMKAAEVEAYEAKRTLLTLDTVTGGPAEGLYFSLGYSSAGIIHGYAYNVTSDVIESATIMYKHLPALSLAQV